MSEEFEPLPPATWRCIFWGGPLVFAWRWLYCSWAHRMVWTQMNALGDYKWKKVGGRCYPHVWHECESWHCSRCHPCGEDLDKFLNAQKPLPPEMAKVIDDNFWDLL